jgi:hypothetical protein
MHRHGERGHLQPTISVGPAKAVKEGISGTQAIQIGSEDLIQKGLLPSVKRTNSSLLPAFTKHAGFYVFGGLTDTGLSGRLTVIEMTFDGLRFIEPKTKGQPPAPRYMHSSHYLSRKKLFVIAGGKLMIGDCMERDLDLFALELVDLVWMKIEAKGKALPTLCSHAAANDDERIFLFGGISQNNYRDSDLLVLEVRDMNSTVEMSPNSRHEDSIYSRKPHFYDALKKIIIN